MCFYDYAYFEIKTIINVTINATKYFFIFTTYIQSWNVTCWKMTFFIVFKLNHSIVTINATKYFFIFTTYIQSWNVTCWKMTFFIVFKLNHSIVKNN